MGLALAQLPVNKLLPASAFITTLPQLLFAILRQNSTHEWGLSIKRNGRKQTDGFRRSRSRREREDESSVECPSIDTADRHKKISQKWAAVGQTTVAAANAHLHTMYIILQHPLKST